LSSSQQPQTPAPPSGLISQEILATLPAEQRNALLEELRRRRGI
jgi:hypothetical protein